MFKSAEILRLDIYSSVCIYITFIISHVYIIRRVRDS